MLRKFVRFVSEEVKDKYKTGGSENHFWNDDYYEIMKFESYSETGEGFVVLINDEGEIWWVSNRDVRCKK